MVRDYRRAILPGIATIACVLSSGLNFWTAYAYNSIPNVPERLENLDLYFMTIGASYAFVGLMEGIVTLEKILKD